MHVPLSAFRVQLMDLNPPNHAAGIGSGSLSEGVLSKFLPSTSLRCCFCSKTPERKSSFACSPSPVVGILCCLDFGSLCLLRVQLFLCCLCPESVVLMELNDADHFAVVGNCSGLGSGRSSVFLLKTNSLRATVSPGEVA